MSFILDALKKSEAERQRQNAPGIANIPEGGRQHKNSNWIWLIVGLLAINLVVITGLVMKPGDEPALTRAETPPATEVRSAPETFSEIVTEAKRTTSPAVSSTPGQMAPVADVAPAAAAETTGATLTVSQGLPSFNELRVRGVFQLPDMHLDIHVYSGQPADRFVFVNMSKYKENATLAEGPVLREITPEGIVLEYQGNRFLLPRE